MARRANVSSSDDDDEENEGDHSRQANQRPRRVNNASSLSPSPAASFSSDKENHALMENNRQPNSKSRAMPPPKTPMQNSDDGFSRASKRPRLSERGVPNASQLAHNARLEQTGDKNRYDPDQTMEERRAVRKGIRDLSRELTDSRSEYLAPTSNGLVQTLEKANEIFVSVKQTSDATLDSRLLVSTADLSARKTTQLNLGDNTAGIDIEEFVGKCITFMRRGPNDASMGTQTQRRRRRRGSNDEDSDAAQDFDEGDAFDWDWLGRQACFPHNVRPPVPGFLLGPLAVQKKIRKQTQRRERLQKQDPRDATRPEELKAQDLQQAENSNLTTLCKNIHSLLREKISSGIDTLNEAVEAGVTDEEFRAACKQCGMAENGEMSFFPFVINPRSFGQTVENLFYVSFLIRDGVVMLGEDPNSLPTLVIPELPDESAPKPKGTQKHQAVFHLDYDTWEDLIEAFEIKECIIPHRDNEEQPQVSASGWYA